MTAYCTYCTFLFFLNVFFLISFVNVLIYLIFCLPPGFYVKLTFRFFQPDSYNL